MKKWCQLDLNFIFLIISTHLCLIKNNEDELIKGKLSYMFRFIHDFKHWKITSLLIFSLEVAIQNIIKKYCYPVLVKPDIMFFPHPAPLSQKIYRPPTHLFSWLFYLYSVTSLCFNTLEFVRDFEINPPSKKSLNYPF